MTRVRATRRRIGFALGAIVLGATLATSVVLAIDLWLHARYARWLGYNSRGYRGAVVGAKRPGEYRIVLLGGSVAYGYAVSPAETISMFLERDLRTRSRSDR